MSGFIWHLVFRVRGWLHLSAAADGQGLNAHVIVYPFCSGHQRKLSDLEYPRAKYYNCPQTAMDQLFLRPSGVGR